MNEIIARYSWWLINNHALFSKFQTFGEKIDAAAELELIIEHVYIPAWESHPDYTALSSKENPTVVAVYEHEALKGHTESFMIAGLNDVLAPAQMKWGERTLGTFKCVRPILPEIQVHPTRISFISWSIKGSGRAFRSRQELRNLLPHKYHKLIGLARKVSGLPKTFHLTGWLQEHSKENYGKKINFRDKKIMPEWYLKSTASELNYKRFVEQAGDDLKGLSRYIDLSEFWKAATGKYHPDEIAKLVTHQINLPGIGQ